MEFIYEIESQPSSMDIEGVDKDKIRVLDNGEVKLMYHAELVDFSESRSLILIVNDKIVNDKISQYTKSSVYALHGTFMKYDGNRLMLSFGGLIGEFEAYIDDNNINDTWCLFVQSV